MSSKRKKPEKKPWTTPEVQRFGSFTDATRNVGQKAFGLADGDIRQNPPQSLASV
jgi:hypothetical protein